MAGEQWGSQRETGGGYGIRKLTNTSPSMDRECSGKDAGAVIEEA